MDILLAKAPKIKTIEFANYELQYIVGFHFFSIMSLFMNETRNRISISKNVYSFLVIVCEHFVQYWTITHLISSKLMS